MSKDIYYDCIDDLNVQYPNESCGLMFLSRDFNSDLYCTEYVSIKNVKSGPQSFQLDPKEQLNAIKKRRGTFDEVAIVHSHPSGPGRFSSKDKEMMFEDGKIWILFYCDSPGLVYYTAIAHRVSLFGLETKAMNLEIDSNSVYL